MRVFGFLISLFFLSACTTIKIQVPQASLIESELTTKDTYELGIHSQASRLHTASTDASRRPPLI